MTLLLLTSALPPPPSLSLPTFDLDTMVVRLVSLIPLIGGYLLSREGRGNLLWEIMAVLLLVLATVVPVQVTYNGLPSLLDAFLGRAPVALLLIGLAFVRDGGWKMIVGLILIIISGLVLLPR
jgi:hypothetical protein